MLANKKVYNYGKYSTSISIVQQLRHKNIFFTNVIRILKCA